MTISIKKTNREPTIEAVDVGYQGKEGAEGSKGKSNKTALRSIFQSPLLGKESISVPGEPGLDLSSAATYRQWFFDNVLKGTVDGNHYGLGQYNREFQHKDNPNLSEVITGAGGLPATPYVPNPTSPGEGSVSPESQKQAPAEFINKLSADGSAFSGKNIVDNSNLKLSAQAIVDNQTA